MKAKHKRRALMALFIVVQIAVFVICHLLIPTYVSLYALSFSIVTFGFVIAALLFHSIFTKKIPDELAPLHEPTPDDLPEPPTKPYIHVDDAILDDNDQPDLIIRELPDELQYPDIG